MPSALDVKEKSKAQQEKFQAVLASLLKDDDNKYCVDCDAKGPRWASWNLGVFLCIRCAGIHRNMGVHISRVKSVNLDTWNADQVAVVMEMGNSRARAVYEANIPDNFRRPQTDSSLEAFIRAKYEHKKYIAKEWVPPEHKIPKELLEDDKNEKKKSKPRQTNMVQLGSASSGKSTSSSIVVSEKKQENTQPKLDKAQSKAAPAASSATDLIGLDISSPAKSNSADLLGDLNDFLGADSQSNQPTPSATVPTSQPMDTPKEPNGTSEPSLFDDSGSKSTKDSIMALYGSGSGSQQQQFGVPGGMYMAQPQNNMAMYGGNMMGQPVPGGMVNVAGAPQYNNQNMMGMNQMPMYSGGMQPVQGGSMMGMPVNMPMGMQGSVPVQGNMALQGNMGMYNNPQMQQMQYQQMQHQMSSMRMSGGAKGPNPGSWGAQQTSGQTLSTNLWQ